MQLTLEIREIFLLPLRTRMDVTYHRDQLTAPLREEYDQFCNRATGGHYMQGSWWGELATAGTRLHRRFLIVRDAGRIVGCAMMIRSSRGFLLNPSAVIERGPVVNDPAMLQHVLPAMLSCVRKHGVMRLRIQPYFIGDDATRARHIIEQLGFTAPAEHDGPHSQSLRLQLPPLANTASADPYHYSNDELFTVGTFSNVRRYAREAEKSGVTVRRGNASDLPMLGEMYNAMMARQDEALRSAAHFAAFAPLLQSERAALFIGSIGTTIVGSVLLVGHGQQATFHLGVTSLPKRPFKKMMLPLLHAIHWARGRGAITFDLGGIPRSEDPDSKRQSIAQFKHILAKTPVSLLPVMYSPDPMRNNLQRIARIFRPAMVAGIGLRLLMRR